MQRRYKRCSRRNPLTWMSKSRMHHRRGMPQTVMRIAAPREDAALRKEALVQPLPAQTVGLNNGLIWHAEGGASGMAPVRWIQADEGLLEGFAGAAEGEEALGV